MVSESGPKNIDRVLVMIGGEMWTIKRGNMTQWDRYRHRAIIDSKVHGAELKRDIARMCVGILRGRNMMSESARIRKEIMQHFE